jgi:uncharacterized membrane protein
MNPESSEIPSGDRGLDRASFPDSASRAQAVLAYALGGFSGVVLLVLRREDRFVQFHSLQSIGATVVAFFIAALLWLLSYFPLLGFLYAILLRVFQAGLFVLWICLLWQAWQGRWFRIPRIGAWAERQVL